MQQRVKEAKPRFKGASSSTPSDDRLSSLEQRASQGGPSRTDADDSFSDDDGGEKSTAIANRKAPAKRAAPKDTASPRGRGRGRGKDRGFQGGLTQTTLNVVTTPRPRKRAAAASRAKSISDDEASKSDKDREDEVAEPAHKIKRTSAKASQRGRKTAAAAKRGAGSGARGASSTYIDDDVEDDDDDDAAGPKKATPTPSSPKRSSWGSLRS